MQVRDVKLYIAKQHILVRLSCELAHTPTMSTEHDFSGIQGYTLATIPESSFRQTVEIAAGARQSFYVTLRISQSMLHSGYTTDTIVTQDDNLIIYNGPANDYPFFYSYPGYPWNGALIYNSDAKPTTAKPTTRKPSTRRPTTRKPTTRKPTTRKPTTRKPIL